MSFSGKYKNSVVENYAERGPIILTLYSFSVFQANSAIVIKSNSNAYFVRQ